MADNDYIGNIQNQRLQQQWTNNMNMTTPSWMRGQFKTGPRVSTHRFKAPSINMRLNWGTDQHIMDRGFNKGDQWSKRYKDKTAPADDSATTGTPLPAPTAGTAVAGSPPTPATPTTPTASTAGYTAPPTGQPRPTISMASNAFQQTPTGQNMGQIRTTWGAVRNARAQRRSSGTTI
jgi:hypothetical protein